MKQELETLRTDLHKMVDEKINALVKPVIEINKWYNISCRNSKSLWFAKEFATDDLTWCRGYGFTNGKYSTAHSIRITEFEFTEATHSEFTEALTKEAVKRYDGKTVLNLITDKNLNPFVKSKLSLDRFHCSKEANKLYHSVASDWSILIFDNGIWAEIVKEPKTIDEWADEFKDFATEDFRTGLNDDFKTFITKHNFKLPE